MKQTKNYLKFHMPVLFVILFIYVMLSACQAIFTYSPMSPLQRDPKTLSDEQKINYAREALASGDKESVEKAYDAVSEMADKDDADAETISLAADLAIEASGTSDTVNSLLSAGLSEESDEEEITTKIDDALTKMDTTYASKASKHIEDLEAKGEKPTTTQYVMTAVTMAASVAKDAGGISSLDDNNSSELTQEQQDTINKASDYIDKAIAQADETGESSDLISQFSGMLNL